MHLKSFFYFVHEANAFVMLRFSFEDDVGSFYDFLAFLNLLINERTWNERKKIPNREKKNILLLS